MRTLLFIPVAILFYTFVAGPVTTLLHELGHGIAAVLLTSGRVTLVQGVEPPLLRFRLGRFYVRLRPLVGARSAFFGYCDHEEEGLSRSRRVAVYAAGPVASLLTIAAFLAVAIPATGIGARLAWVGAAAGLIGFLATAIPMRYGRWSGPYAGWESDGLGILRLLRSPASETPPSGRSNPL